MKVRARARAKPRWSCWRTPLRPRRARCRIPVPKKWTQLIRKLVRDKLNDGQLNDCSLTFNDLDKICSALSDRADRRIP